MRSLAIGVRRLSVIVVGLCFGVPWASAAVAQAPPYLLSWGSHGSGDGQFSQPRGIAVGLDGTVYVTDFEPNSRVQQFSASGAFIRKWGGPGFSGGKFSQPVDVCVVPDGSVYVLDRG